MADSPDRHSKEALTAEAAKEAPEQAAKEKPSKKDKNKEEEKGARTSVGQLQVAPVKPAARYAPNYRLDPKNPLRKERLEIIVKAEMDKNYDPEYTFHPKHSLRMAAQVSEDIKTRIKGLNFDRYRYIVLITVGEYLMQGLCSLANFLWDAERDGYVNYAIESTKFYAVCTVFYIYFD